jgi:hypothetical protein
VEDFLQRRIKASGAEGKPARMNPTRIRVGFFRL